MKNKVTTVLSLLCTTLLLNGCGTEKENNNRIVEYFGKDTYTLRVDSVDYVNNSGETDNDSKEHDTGYDETLSEITLVGDDTSVSYDVINGTDVEYRGTSYKNLYTNIQYIDTNYDKNTLINFIIKTYESKSSLIYTVLTTNTMEADGSDIEAITFDDMLLNVDKYEEVKHKYGEAATWMLQLIDSDTRREVQIFGAKSYILVTADGISSDIDMTKYDAGIDNTDTAIETDNAGDMSEDNTGVQDDSSTESDISNISTEGDIITDSEEDATETDSNATETIEEATDED